MKLVWPVAVAVTVLAAIQGAMRVVRYGDTVDWLLTVAMVALAICCAFLGVRSAREAAGRRQAQASTRDDLQG